MTGLPLPRLDDRRFDDLVADARSVVPTLAGGWTDHNPADPGITLVELFAWLAEQLIYRADQLPDNHRIAFLRLLNGPLWQPDGRPVDAQVAETLRRLRTRYRAVTSEDWEALAVEASAQVARARCVPRRHLELGPETDLPGYISVVVVPSPLVVLAGAAGTTRLDGAQPLPLLAGASDTLYLGAPAVFRHVYFGLAEPGTGYTLRFEYSQAGGWAELPGVVDGTAGWTHHGGVGFAPPEDWSEADVAGTQQRWIRIATSTVPTRLARATRIVPRPLARVSETLTSSVSSFLEPRRMLTTHHYVGGPTFAPVQPELVVCRRADVPPATVLLEVEQALERHLDSHAGGSDGEGWPFGRSVLVSELYEQLDRLASVDFVPDIGLASVCESDEPGCVPGVALWHENGDLVGLRLQAHQLPDLRFDPKKIFVSTRFTALTLRAAVRPATSAAAAARAVKEALRRHFHPAYGGPDGSGEWGPRKLAALRTLVSKLPEVAGVADLRAASIPPQRISLDAQGQPEITIETGELVDLTLEVRVVE